MIMEQSNKTTKKTDETPKKKRLKPLLKHTGVKEVEQIVSTDDWAHCITGEVRTMITINRPETGDFGFHKVWLEDFGRIVGILGGGKVKVFNHILNNINPISNQFGGTIRELAAILVLDSVTIQTTIRILIEQGFMKRIRSGTYQINPEILVQGKHTKRVGLMINYDRLENSGRI